MRGVEIKSFILHVTLPQPKVQFPEYSDAGADPRHALKGEREAFWDEYGEFKNTLVYNQGLLKTGNEIDGPAIIEAENTTLVLPPEARLSVDKYLNMVIEKI